MREGRLEIRAGGTPTPAQLAAIATAVTALLEEERAGEPHPVPAAYRSRWRRAAILEALGDRGRT